MRLSFTERTYATITHGDDIYTLLLWSGEQSLLSSGDDLCSQLLLSKLR